MLRSRSLRDRSSISGVAAAGEDLTVTGAIGDISGQVTSLINQLPASTDSNQPGIKELLEQLQWAIAIETDLEDEDKGDALEQVQNLAEASQNPDGSEKKTKAAKAIRMLNRIVAGLPTATKLVEQVNKLLPAIGKLLGLG